MNNLKAIIVDDELSARNVLSNLLALAHPEINIVDKCSSVPEAVMSIRSLKPDVVFLDVEMPQFSGYEIVNFFDEVDFQIVFVTAYDKYAIKAFEVNAIDYLLKPVERKRLGQTVEKIKKKATAQKKLVNYKEFLDKHSQKINKSLFFSEKTGEHKKVKIAEISAIFAKGAYSEVHLTDGTKMVVSKNIGAIEEDLNDDELFFRTHKSYIINVSEILMVNKSNETIQLKNGLVCKLSRFKKTKFQELFRETPLIDVEIDFD